MIQRALAQFARVEDCEVMHLKFNFTPDLRRARKGSVGKFLELLRVVGRLFRIRAAGPIDLLLYPTGGPQRVPMIRDLLLLPWMLIFSRRVVLHFHAAGAADQFEKGGAFRRRLRSLYGKAFAAVVMTNFNRRDPLAAGLHKILVIPHRLEDEFDPGLHGNNASTERLLYVGHLCEDKGTPQLLQAFAELRRKDASLHLELVGECLPPFNDEKLQLLLDQLEIRPFVRKRGLLTGKAKDAAFANADLFVFPTIAPYESFGLVLVEAMMWGLPIVASDWRGNREVLTDQAGAICFEVSPDLTCDLKSALTKALLEKDEWAEWRAINREIFEKRYCDDGHTLWLAEPLLSLLSYRSTRDF